MKNLLLKILLLSCFTIISQINDRTARANIFATDDIQYLSPPRDSFIFGNNADSKIGNVEVGKQNVCLKIQNPNLKIGDKVLIVLPEIPQKALPAEILQKDFCQTENFGDLTGDNAEIGINEYSLKLLKREALNRGFGIGIVETVSKFKIANGLVSIDLDNDKRNEYFRECTSNEGAHFTVWSGKPLIGKRIWHSYYHFDYDTEPTCQEKDYQDAGN